jgi:hypothetical protein
MAISLDVANVGTGTGDNGGATNPTLTLTTSSAVAAGARLFFTVALNTASGTGTFNLPTASGITFVAIGQAADGNGPAQRGGSWYADCPSGLASSTVITVTSTFTAAHWWVTGASSYKADGGFVADGAADTQTGFTTTSWTSGSKTTSAAALIFSGVSARQPASSTPTAPGVEDKQSTNSSMLLLHQRRIESSAGTYTNAGTFNANTDGYTVITQAFKEAANTAGGGFTRPGRERGRFPLRGARWLG